MPFRLKKLPAVLKDAFKKWLSKDPFRESAVIAYNAIFSLPGLMVVIVTLAGYFFGKEIINERIHEYRQALKKDHDDATAHYGLGVAYFSLGLLEESVDEPTEAARTMPENPHIQAQLGVVLNELGRQQRPEYTAMAWRRLERALMLEPGNEDALALREDLLKQRLRAADTSPHELADARRQLLETWSALVRVDEERARRD